MSIPLTSASLNRWSVANTLELRNLSAFVRMCIAEKVNPVLGKETPLPVYVASKDKH